MKISMEQILDQYEHDPELLIEVLGTHGYHYQAQAVEKFINKEPMEPQHMLETWQYNQKITARYEQEWFIKTDLDEKWRARRWHRREVVNVDFNWIEGNLTDFLTKRVPTNFKRDQFDFVIKEMIRVYDMDPVEFWPMGRYHQHHDLCGAANDKILVISSWQNIYICPLHQDGGWQIGPNTARYEIKGKFDKNVLNWLINE